MAFRSLTADQTLMDIYTKTIESDHPEEGTTYTDSGYHRKLHESEA